MFDHQHQVVVREGEASDVSGVLSKVRLKWFNIPRGFGFVVPEDDPACDAFLHITTLQRAGIEALGEGASLLCCLQRGPRGALVSQVVELIDAGVFPEPVSGAEKHALVGKVYKMNGTVKWYKPDKGFGFISPADGMKDVFVHKTCLAKCGLSSLEAGQSVSVVFKTVPKGREAIDITVSS